MATNRHPIRHSHRGRLNHPQEMVLRYGEDPRWDAFATEDEHRDAWIRNRDRLWPAAVVTGRRAGGVTRPGISHIPATTASNRRSTKSESSMRRSCRAREMVA